MDSELERILTLRKEPIEDAGRNAMSEQVGHWLISIGCRGADVHGYLMATESVKAQVFEGSVDKMIGAAEARGLGMVLPAVLVTPLDAGGIGLVRGVIEGLTELREHLAAPDACFCVFGMMHGPENERLMALH